jgi:hypothetical protein
MSLLIAGCRLVANQLAPITLLGAVVAYLYPPLFMVFKSSFLPGNCAPRCANPVASGWV